MRGCWLVMLAFVVLVQDGADRFLHADYQVGSVVTPGSSACHNLVEQNIAALQSPDRATRLRAINALSAFPREGCRACPQLLHWYLHSEDEELVCASYLALVTMGRHAIPYMRRDLLNPAGVHHFQLCEVLKFMGPEARDALPILSTLALHGMSVEARYHAIGVLAHMAPGNSIPVLCKILETETNTTLQTATLWAIMNSGDRAREAVPLVMKLADAPYEVGEQAVRTLAHLDTEHSIAALLSIINDRRRDECVRCAAVLALRNTTAKREAIVPHLSKALKDPEPSVRWNAVAALTRSATPSTTPMIVQSIMPLTLDGDPKVRIRALEAIHRLDPENQFVIPKLLQEARHPSLDVRYEALCGLRRIDPHMRISTDVFCKALTDYRPKVRRLATIHLAAQPNNAIAPYFPLLLTDRDRDIRRLAKKAFEQLSKPKR